MQTIHIRTQLDSTTLHLPEVQSLVGKRVEILVREDSTSRPASEEEWLKFFAAKGVSLIDPDIVQQYRGFDRDQSTAPPL